MLLSLSAGALEIEGFLTKKCEQRIGLIVHVDEQQVDFIQEDGHIASLSPAEIETLYVFNVIENPFSKIELDDKSLPFLKQLYLEDSKEPQTFAFPVRFIDDLLIFYSLDGKTRVQTFSDIYKLRPAPENLKGTHATGSHHSMQFSFTDPSTHCPVSKAAGTRPTRILSDRISISEFLLSFKKGYDSLESFEERTYLYAKPFLYQRKARLGIVVEGQREEPAITAPVYFQWASGEPYRFQSFNVIGLKSHEFTPTTEPVFSLRSDVKSHVFHGLFIGNVAGLAAGKSVFLQNQELMKLNDDVTFAPSFNYIAMMGGDFGPYSASVGFYYPTYGIRVGNQQREVLGDSVSYAFRGMFTKPHYRLRVVGAVTKHASGQASQADVLSQAGSNPSLSNPDSFNFASTFVRGGIDYEISDRLTVGSDCTVVNASYSETFTGKSSSLNFNKLTVQGYVQRAFGNYVAVNGYLNFIQKNYDGVLVDQDAKTDQREMVYFGSLEFIF